MTQEMDVALAMDWGGTWCRIAVTSREGDILWQSRVRNAQGADAKRLLTDSRALIDEARKWCGRGRSVAGLGVAAAGPIDSETGTFREPPNLGALDGVSLKGEWESDLGLEVHVGNDANLAALGELVYGAGLEARHRRERTDTLVYVTVSTGIGGGVIDRGRMLLGAQGMAAEVGHMVIDRRAEAPMCQCGNRGCLEALASGTAIALAARRLAGESKLVESKLGDIVPSELRAEHVFSAAEEGDSVAWLIMDDVIDNLSVGFTNLLHLYNPDLLVMGGGVTFGLVRMGLLPRIYGQMKQRAMSDGHRDFRLVPSRLGDTPGMLGAASLVWSNS